MEVAGRTIDFKLIKDDFEAGADAQKQVFLHRKPKPLIQTIPTLSKTPKTQHLSVNITPAEQE